MSQEHEPGAREQIEGLSQSKRALLDRLVGRAEAAVAASQEIPAQERDGPCVLSFNQGRQWFLERLNPDTGAYNVATAHLRLEGPLDVPTLEAALRAVVERHEILRTRFFENEDGVPLQEVLEEFGARLEVVDCPTGPESPPGELDTLIREVTSASLDLVHGPLFRLVLFRRSEEENVLVRVMNHMVSDGWSGRVFFRDLGDAYSGLLEGAEPRWEPLPLQYADFAAWQRTEFGSAPVQPQLDFWRKKLRDAPQVLGWTPDRSRPPVQDHGCTCHTESIPLPLVKSLQEASLDASATPFMVLISAYAHLLSVYSGEDDVVVGVPVAGRRQSGLENLIGFFANSLPLRFDTSGDPTFRELLGRVRRVAIDAFANQDVPLERIVAVAAPARDLSIAPVFQMMFQFQNFPTELPRFEGIVAEYYALTQTQSAFDMSVWIVPMNEGWHLTVVYATALFNKTTVRRMAGHYIALLEGVVRSPDVPLSQIPLCLGEETRLTLDEWNRTEVSYPRDSCIHELFEEQVRGAPERVALVCEKQRVTYGELNVRANRLARHLIELGIGRETVVGLLAHRDIDSIVAILAILKAGGAYLPLDPEEPASRLEFMIADGDARVVIARSGWHRTAIPGGIPVVDLPAIEPTLDHLTGDNLGTDCTADGLACILFTSGSTGKPKGVEVLHRNVVRLVRGRGSGFPADRVYSHISSLWFDGSAYEIWGAMLNGGCCAINTHRIPTAAQLLEFYRDQRITATYLVQGLFNFVAAECPEALAGVREVRSGGDVMSPTHLDAVLAAAPGARIFNTYGPTECGTSATTYEVTVPRWNHAEAVPIGRPLPNTTAYVCDRGGNVCPPGIPGELYVGGDGVARGYRDRPELTAHSFVPDHLSHGRPGRLYRTGDRCRYRDDGNIEFLGRADNQVKIRGFRVELGEVEVALSGAPGVGRAVAVVRDDDTAGRVIVAYVVPQAKDPPSPSQLKEYLAQRLPGHMVPGAYVVLETLPLTSAGKIDRRRLPAPEIPRRATATERANEGAERELTAIWETVLGVEGIGLDENFFELGGHSLLALRLLARIEKTTGVRASLEALFQHPTVRGFSEVCQRGDR